MTLPLELTYRGLTKSDFLENAVSSRYEKLSRLDCGITYCHVILDSPNQNQLKGRDYEVHIEVRVPGSQLAVTRKTTKKGVQEDLYPVIADAFSAIERQLIKWNDKRHLDVKAHSRPAKPLFEDSDQ